jgi:Spy/CpxP family protein refolding chaperone
MGPPPPHDFAMGGLDEGPIGMLKEELNMTDQQRKQLRMLQAGFLDRTRKARMALMSLKDEHRAMMLTGAPDIKKLAQLDEQEVKLVSEIMAEKFKTRRDRLALLTSEQVEKLSALMADKRPPHKMHPGHGRDKKDAPEKPGR